jgi:membrane protein DedA with SNARE-associated domain
MDYVKALSPFVFPVVAGAVLGYRYPRTDVAKLLAPGVALAIAAWIVFGWLGEGGADVDLDRTGRILLWLVLLLLLLGLWTGGAVFAQWTRRKRSGSQDPDHSDSDWVS